MKVHVRLFKWFSVPAAFTLVTALFFSLSQFACKGPQVVPDVYTCRDRVIHVNVNAPSGVDEDPVVVCHSHKLNWIEKNNEVWDLEFVDSPFEQGEKKIKKGDPPPSPTKTVANDTAFKYAITVNGLKHDPQIIIMGQ
jgi:hypothetical protein